MDVDVARGGTSDQVGLREGQGQAGDRGTSDFRKGARDKEGLDGDETLAVITLSLSSVFSFAFCFFFHSLKINFPMNFLILPNLDTFST